MKEDRGGDSQRNDLGDGGHYILGQDYFLRLLRQACAHGDIEREEILGFPTHTETGSRRIPPAPHDASPPLLVKPLAARPRPKDGRNPPLRSVWLTRRARLGKSGEEGVERVFEHGAALLLLDHLQPLFLLRLRARTRRRARAHQYIRYSLKSHFKSVIVRTAPCGLQECTVLYAIMRQQAR